MALSFEEHIAGLVDINAQQKETISQLESEKSALEQRVLTLEATIADKDALISAQAKTIQTLETEIDEKDQTINSLQQTINTQQQTISDLEAEVQRLQDLLGSGSSGSSSSPEPPPPDARIWWPDTTPDTFTLTKASDIPFEVADTSANHNVLALAQTEAQTGPDTEVIGGFTFSVDVSGNLVVPAAKLNALPEGKIRLQLLLRDNASSAIIEKAYHWITAEAAVIVDPIPPDPTPDPTTSKIGMNLHEPNFWSSNIVQSNALYQAKYRGDLNFGGKKPWLLFWEVTNKDGDFPRSGYEIEPASAGSLQVNDSGVAIFVPEDALAQGVAVWHPGADKNSYFHPKYKDNLAPFGILRFMDWLGTNHSPAATWADLRARAHVPIRQMILLCNAVKAKPWVCIPHMADDDCITKFAQLVKDNLDSDLDVYVEYSNELWNGQFSQTKWLHGNDLSWDHDVWAAKIRKVKNIWGNILGNRAKAVLAAQSANVWHAQKVVENLNDNEWDILSCAAYWGGKGVWSGSVDATLDSIAADIDTEVSGWTKHKNLANNHGKPLVAYEAGNHVFKRDMTSQQFRDVHAHPRMYDLTKYGIERAFAAGFDEYVYFYDCQTVESSGGWGAKTYQDQPLSEAHKHRAILDSM